ncbi:hypothetical protein [Primorskyibacter sp. S187A]|uniref:hypothetical protein n=1 Tax=Primorskyibacter sp. S187A TaxID=3415130 RepID=UPI003C799F3D
MKNWRIILGILGVVALSACQDTANQSSAPDVFMEVPVTSAFNEITSGVTGKPRPGLIIQWRGIAVDDEIAICGAITYPDPSQRSATFQVLGNAYVELNGEKIMRNLRFFKNTRYTNAPQWDVANCVKTGASAAGPVQLRLGWDAQRVNL